MSTFVPIMVKRLGFRLPGALAKFTSIVRNHRDAMAIVLIDVPAPIIGFNFTYLKSTYVLAYVLSKYVKSKATHPS